MTIFSAPYVDPDYVAAEASDQIPVISSIGRGPRGHGLKVKTDGTDADHGKFAIQLFDDVTGECVMDSGDIGPGNWEISTGGHVLVDGETGHLFIIHRHGDHVHQYDIPIPCGAHGSRNWIAGEYDARIDCTYAAQREELYHYGLTRYIGKPDVREGDTIFCVIKKSTGIKALGIGTVRAVEGSQVVFTCKTSVEVPIPQIGDDGYWYVDGERTEVRAKGDKGEKGDTGPRGLRGAQGAQGVQGKQGDKGDPGKDGIDGKDAHLVIGDVKTVDYDDPARVFNEIDEASNTNTLSFELPKGAPGEALHIRDGVWKEGFLPDFESTPINDAFIVEGDDKQFDLYIRGPKASTIGTWTIVENFQGRPGCSFHMMAEGKLIDVDEPLHVPVDEVNQYFIPSAPLSDGDLVMDAQGHIGMVSSAEDHSGDYVITAVSELQFTTSFNYEDAYNKPTINGEDMVGELGDQLTQLLTELVPIATVEKVGIVKPDGESILITEDGTISTKALKPEDLPIATVEQAGMVKPDGDSIKITPDGTISCSIQITAAELEKLLTPEELEKILSESVLKEALTPELLKQVLVKEVYYATLPPASNEQLGAMKPNPDDFTIAEDGTLSFNESASERFKGDTGGYYSPTVEEGTLSFTAMNGAPALESSWDIRGPKGDKGEKGDTGTAEWPGGTDLLLGNGTTVSADTYQEKLAGSPDNLLLADGSTVAKDRFQETLHGSPSNVLMADGSSKDSETWFNEVWAEKFPQPSPEENPSILLNDGSVLNYDDFIDEVIEDIRTKLGIVTKAKDGLVPKLPS